MESVKQTVTIEEIKTSYPDEWILLGNPEINEEEQSILSGVLVYHSADKREVCYLGRPLIKDYETTAMFFNRVTPRKTNRVLANVFLPVNFLNTRKKYERSEKPLSDAIHSILKFLFESNIHYYRNNR